MTWGGILPIFRRIGALAFTLLTAVAVAQNPAANVCATIVQSALQAANDSCSSTSRNQVCYGHILNIPTPADGIEALNFAQAGDIAALAQIKALQLTPLDPETEEWGVALMQIQANLPNTLPGQNVTFLLFGDVEIEENIGVQARIPAVVTTAANVRLGPNDTSPILGSLAAGTDVTGTGKTINRAGQTWMRVEFEDYRTRTGWMFAPLVEADLDEVPDVPSDSLVYNPMQAFYFRTGIGQTACAEAPADGVVVQTPQGAGRVNFNVNGIDVLLGSTAYITAPEETGKTCVSLITGSAELRSSGDVMALHPGERTCAPLLEDGEAGPPEPAQPFDANEMRSIEPLLDLLPDDVELPDPAPTRTPTPRAPTATATYTPVPEQPTNTPGSVFVPPTNTPLPTNTLPPGVTPTATETPVPRFFNIFASGRAYTTVSFDSNFGPDSPVSISWDFSDGTFGSGTTVSNTYEFGTWDVFATACWADSQCIDSQTQAIIPLCAIDFSSTGTISFEFIGGTEMYRIFKKDEDCNPIDAGTLDEGNAFLQFSTNRGEFWEARDAADQVIWSTVIVDPPGDIFVQLGG